MTQPYPPCEFSSSLMRFLSGKICCSLAYCFLIGTSKLEAARTELSVGPLSGADDAEVEVPLSLQNADGVVGLQLDFEPVAGRFEPTSFVAGEGAQGLQVRSAVMTNGHFRVVLFSASNRRVKDGVVLKVRGIRRSQEKPMESGLSLRAVTIADERALLREFAFAPYVSLSPRTNEALPGQSIVFDGLIFPSDQSVDGFEVRVNGRLVSQPMVNQQGRFSLTWTPLEAGTAFVSAVGRNGMGGAVSLSIPVAGEQIDSYEKWRAFHFPSDPSNNQGAGNPLEDADRDSVLNLWEYISGSGPHDSGEGPADVEHITHRIGADTFVGLRVSMRGTANDFKVVGEASSSLTFDPAGLTPAVVVSREPAGDYVIITMRDTVPVRAGTQRFLRARVRPVVE